MGTNEGAIKKMLQKYKYKDLTAREVLSTIALYKDLKAVPDNYVFNDGIMKELVSLNGTIPVPYKGNVYNIPVQLWLFDTHPYNPPICFVKPTNSMMIKQSKHVDANGRIYLPYLHEWKPNTSDILGLIQVMVVVFAEEPPVFSRSANAAPSPQYGSGYTSYPAVSHPSTPYTPMPMPATPPTFPPSYPATPGGYIQYQYPGHVTPYPSQPVYNHPSPVNVVPQQDGTITEDHIRISLESAITDKLRRRFGEEMSRGQAELEALKRTEDDLYKGRQKLSNMVENLDKEIEEVDHNIELLQRKDKELTDTLKRMEEHTTNDDIDEAVVTTTPLYRQILGLYAEENATEDTMFFLGEALRRGVIDLDAFLKHVRLLSRKQFQLRALMQKARKVAGLVEQY